MNWTVSEIPPEMSARMRNMSFVCALMVVCIHCNASESVKHDVFWLVQLTSHTLCGIAVPFFFMASGFLLSGKMNESGWWRRETLKRVKTLLVPFLIASAMFILFSLPIDAIKDMRHGDVFKHNPFVNGNAMSALGLDLRSTPLLAPLWYVRALFILVVFSPVVKWCVHYSKGFVVPLLFTAYYIYSPLIDGEPLRSEMGSLYGFFKYGIPLEGLSYFALGVALRRWKSMDALSLGRCGAWVFAALGLGISIYRTMLVHSGVQPSVHWSVLAVPCYLFAIFSLMPSRPFPNIFVANAFAIFIVHYFPNFLYSRFVGKAAKHWHTMLLNFAFVVPVTLCICEALRRKCSRFAKVLFGGR